MMEKLFIPFLGILSFIPFVSAGYLSVNNFLMMKFFHTFGNLIS